MKRIKEKKSGVRRGKRILCRLCIAFILGICLLQYADGAYFFPAQGLSVCEKTLKDGEQAYVSGIVYKKAIKKDKNILYLDKVQIIEPDIGQENTGERLLVYLSEDSYSENFSHQVPKIGERVAVCGTVGFFQESPNPGNFNQKFYYQKQNIHAVLWEGIVRGSDSGSVGIIASLRENLWQFRTRTAKEICGYVGERQGGILCSMLLGEGTYVEETLLESYRQSGIGHLLAISGLHVSFLGMGLYSILRKAGLPLLPSALAGSMALCLYVVLSGASVSALRACTMFLLRMGAAATGREYDGLTALSAAALLILGRNPLQLFDAGFLLSFGAVLGIYMTAPILWGKKETNKSSGVFHRITATLKISFAMQITVLPATFYYYYETCVYSMIWNLIAVPMAGGIFACGMAGIFLNQTKTWLDGSILWQICAPFSSLLKKAAGASIEVAALGLRFYEWGSGVVLSLPGARWVAGKPSQRRLILYSFALCILLGLRFWGRRKKKRKEYALLTAQLSSLCLALGILAFPQGRRGEMEAVMLNVGQGDSFFMRGPTGDTYLIDGGSSSVNQVGKYRLEPFLKSQGVGRLDYVFLSHGDADHVNGVEELITRRRTGVEICRLVLPPVGYWDEKLKEIAALARGQDISVLTMEQGMRFSEENMHVTCLWPRSREKEDREPENSDSMVLSVTFGELDILFTGDLEKEGEDEVTAGILKMQEERKLPERYEVLKAGHHGSKNASKEEFLRAVRPKTAWISAGEGNRYGHPHQEALERLANVGAKLYNTKDGSAVILHTNGKKYSIRKQK